MVLPDSVTTLYQFNQHGQTITAYCNHHWVRSHYALLQLDLLAMRLGWQFDFFAGGASALLLDLRLVPP